jgi:hypothetical protein
MNLECDCILQKNKLNKVWTLEWEKKNWKEKEILILDDFQFNLKFCSNG